MHDIQQILNMVSKTNSQTRSKYHLTLGGLIDELAKRSEDDLVVLDNGLYLEDCHSYRGYYEDLAFNTTEEPQTVATLLSKCKNAWGAIYTAYKGGEYLMTSDTPLWTANYGDIGLAIVGYRPAKGGLILTTKDVD